MKILMVAMALGIGGAETHLAELSKALSRRGHEVWIASAGGVYAEELEKEGIRHVTLPLNRRNPALMLYAASQLRKLQKKQHFDILHAHARIPAFVTRLVSLWDHSFRFVTTAHGVYRMSPLFSVKGLWGQRSLAVSCDVKDYLIASYGVPSDKIELTVNGIDVSRFSPLADPSAFLKETAPFFSSGDALSSAPLSHGTSKSTSSHRIMTVSRMDEASALHAFLLIEASDRLIDSFPDLEIYLIGGGTAENELHEKAEEKNKRFRQAIGRNVILAAGPRTDVESVVAACDIFVGVSRSLLEAMAEEKPVILAGAQGRIGVLTQDVLPLAAETNFCGRGCPLPTADALADDIRTLFSLSQSERDKLGKQNRYLVESGYSIERMASDAERLYQAAPVRKYAGGKGGVVLNGYYGFGNSGDDLLLDSMIDSLREADPSLPITVLSRRPRMTARQYGVKSRFRFGPVSILSSLLSCSLFLSGGGTLLSDHTSMRSLFYYSTMIRLAAFFHKPAMVYGSGIGPVSTPCGRRMTLRALACCSAITLREDNSRKEVLSYLEEARNDPKHFRKEWGSIPDKIKVTADPAFLMRLPDPLWQKHLFQEEGFSPNQRYFALALRPFRDNASDFEAQIETVCRALHQKSGLIPVFFAMQRSLDLPLALRLADRLRDLSPIVIGDHCASELASLLGYCEITVGMRLHSILYSAVAGTPSVCLSYDPKVDAMAEMLKLPLCRPSSADFAASLTEELLKMLTDSEASEVIRKNLAVFSDSLRQKAGQDARLAVSLAKRIS